MPTYEYRCDKCGTDFEAWQGINDDPLTECKSCGETGVRRLISSGGGIVFKGSGFYATDYRSPRSGADKKSESQKKPADNVGGKTEPKGKPADD